MGKIFGTDGIRGRANQYPMTAETALKVAMATALQFQNGTHKHKAIIGKDTRLSGYMVEQAMTAGFLAMGMDVVLVGPMPTPAVAMLTRSMRADLGVMISASHNPYQDNGIKIFGPDGYKLSDAVEEEIEGRLNGGFDKDLVPAEDLGRAARLDDALGRYIEFAKNSFPKYQSLDGLKIVVDCANGAAYKAAPQILWELGAEVIAMGVQPNGRNINLECGATATDAMCKRVVEEGADLGIALDGDADRLIMCDEKGEVIDGDQLMALIAAHLYEEDRLDGDGVVATVMSNLGFEKFLESKGLRLVRMPVGDRYVVDHMRANDYNLGGEQSGHIILSDCGTTGDGLIAALQVLSIIVLKGKPVSGMCRLFDLYPQVLKNVRYEGSEVSLEDQAVQDAIKEAEERLGEQGRILIRKSGTEPLIRVMAEGQDKNQVTEVVDFLCASIETLAQTDKAA